MSYTPTNWANGKAPALNAENLNKIEKKLAELDALTSVPDITETTETTMPNSYDGRLLVEKMGGVCEQVTTNGNNLIDIDYTITGHKLPIPLEAGTYTLSFKTTASTGGFRLSNSTDTSTNSVVMTGGKDASGYVVLSLTTNFVSNYINISSDSGTISEVMLNAGATALPYEPYTGGIPSPNPSYPQEIKKSVVSGVKTHGKNLIKLENLSVTSYGVSVTIDDGVVKTNGTANNNGGYNLARINLKKGRYYTNITTYRRSAKNDWLETIQPNTAFEVVDESQVFVPLLWFASGTTYNETIIPMICLEEYKDGVEPYKESTIALSQPIDLYGIGDVQDTIECGKVKRRFGKVVFDGSADEYWYSENNYFRLQGVNTDNTVPILCSHLQQTKIYDEINSNSKSGTIWVIVNGFSINMTGICSTVAELRSWLAENQLTVIYGLPTPTEEDLPLADQIALNSLSTYDGITYLEFDSEIEPTFEGEYGTSKVGGYTLEALLTARSK